MPAPACWHMERRKKLMEQSSQGFSGASCPRTKAAPGFQDLRCFDFELFDREERDDSFRAFSVRDVARLTLFRDLSFRDLSRDAVCRDFACCVLLFRVCDADAFSRRDEREDFACCFFDESRRDTLRSDLELLRRLSETLARSFLSRLLSLRADARAARS